MVRLLIGSENHHTGSFLNFFHVALLCLKNVAVLYLWETANWMGFLCLRNHSLLSITLSICCHKGRLWAQTQALLLIFQYFQFHQLSSWAFKKISEIIPKQRRAGYSFTVSVEMLEVDFFTYLLDYFANTFQPFMYGSWQFTKPLLIYYLG